MTSQIKLQWLWAIPFCTAALLMGGCQEKPKAHTDETQKTSTAKQSDEPVSVIQGKVQRIKLDKNQFCDDQGCTQYDLQTVKTNVPWIDNYFLERIRKAVPNAFTAETKDVKVDTNQQGVNQSSIYVRYISQNNNLATFAIQSYEYAAGAAHGMHHQEFVTFDLTTHKRLALSDILKPNVEAQLVQQLYEANSLWLEQHSITPDKLQLSDNYYYGVNGVVFVYPLYELASYAEGMPELKLPYSSAKDLIKPEYLPGLPQYASQ